VKTILYKLTQLHSNNDKMFKMFNTSGNVTRVINYLLACAIMAAEQPRP